MSQQIPEYQETIFLEQFASLISNATSTKSIPKLFSDEQLSEYLDLYQTRFSQLEDDFAAKRYIGGSEQSHQYLLDSMYHQVSILRLVYIIISVNEAVTDLGHSIPPSIPYMESIYDIQNLLTNTQGILLLLVHIIKWVETHRKPTINTEHIALTNTEDHRHILLNPSFVSPFTQVDDVQFHRDPSYSILSSLINHFALSKLDAETTTEHSEEDDNPEGTGEGDAQGDLNQVLSANSLMWFHLTTLKNVMATDDSVVPKHHKWRQFCEIATYYYNELDDILANPPTPVDFSPSSPRQPGSPTSPDLDVLKANPSIAVMYALIANINSPSESIGGPITPSHTSPLPGSKFPACHADDESHTKDQPLLLLCSKLAAADGLDYTLTYLDSIWITLHQAIFRVINMFFQAEEQRERVLNTPSLPQSLPPPSASAAVFDPVDLLLSPPEERLQLIQTDTSAHQSGTVSLLTSSLLSSLSISPSNNTHVPVPSSGSGSGSGGGELESPSSSPASSPSPSTWCVRSLSKSMAHLLTVDQLLREQSQARLSAVHARYHLLSFHMYSPIIYAIINQDYTLLSQTLTAAMNNFTIWTPLVPTNPPAHQHQHQHHQSRGMQTAPGTPSLRAPHPRPSPTVSTTDDVMALSHPQSSSMVSPDPSIDEHQLILYLRFYFSVFGLALGLTCCAYDYAIHTYDPDYDYQSFMQATSDDIIEQPTPSEPRNKPTFHKSNTAMVEHGNADAGAAAAATHTINTLESPAVFHHFISSQTSLHYHHVLSLVTSLWWSFPLMHSPLQIQHQQHYFPGVSYDYYHHIHFRRYIKGFNAILSLQQLDQIPLFPLVQPLPEASLSHAPSLVFNPATTVPVSNPFHNYSPHSTDASITAPLHSLHIAFDHYRIACTFPAFLSSLLPPSLFVPFYIAFVSSLPTSKHQSSLLTEAGRHPRFHGRLPYISKMVVSNNIAFSLSQISNPHIYVELARHVQKHRDNATAPGSRPRYADNSNRRRSRMHGASRLSIVGQDHQRHPSTPQKVSRKHPAPAFSLFQHNNREMPHRSALNSSSLGASSLGISALHSSVGPVDNLKRKGAPTPVALARPRQVTSTVGTPRGKFMAPIDEDEAPDVFKHSKSDENGNNGDDDDDDDEFFDIPMDEPEQLPNVKFASKKHRTASTTAVHTPSKAKFTVSLQDSDDDDYDDDKDGNDDDDINNNNNDSHSYHHHGDHLHSTPVTKESPQHLPSRDTAPPITTPTPATALEPTPAQLDNLDYNDVLKTYFVPPQHPSTMPASHAELTKLYTTTKEYVLSSLSKMYGRVVSTKPKSSQSSSRRSLRKLDNVSPIALVSQLVGRNDPKSSLARLYGWVSCLTTVELSFCTETPLATSQSPPTSSSLLNTTAMVNPNMPLVSPHIPSYSEGSSAPAGFYIDNDRHDRFILRKLFNAGSIALCSTDLQMINDLVDGLIPVEITMVSSSIRTMWAISLDQPDLTLPRDAYPDASLISILSLYNATMRAYISTGNLPYAMYTTVLLKDVIADVSDRLERYFTYLISQHNVNSVDGSPCDAATSAGNASSRGVHFSSEVLIEIETKGNIYKESQVWLSYFDYLSSAYAFISSITLVSNTRRLYLNEKAQIDGVWDETTRLYANDCLRLTQKVSEYINALALFDPLTMNSKSPTPLLKMLSYSDHARGKSHDDMMDSCDDDIPTKSFNSNVHRRATVNDNSKKRSSSLAAHLTDDPDLVFSDDDDSSDGDSAPSSSIANMHVTRIGSVISSLFDEISITGSSHPTKPSPHTDPQPPAGFTNIRAIETSRIRPYIIAQILYLSLAVLDAYIDSTAYLDQVDTKKALACIHPDTIHSQITRLIKVILQIVFRLIAQNKVAETDQPHTMASDAAMGDGSASAYDVQRAQLPPAHHFPPCYIAEILETLRVSVFRYYVIKKR